MSDQPENHHNFKIVLLGAPLSGKSTFANYYTQGKLIDDLVPTAGIDYKTKTITLTMNEKDLIIKMDIWDCSGQEKYHEIMKQYTKGATAFLIFFDLSDKKTYEQIRYFHDLTKNESQAVTLLIGSKSDKPREVQQEEGQSLADKLSIQYQEISSTKQSLQEINAVFHSLIKSVFEYQQVYDANKVSQTTKVKELLQQLQLNNQEHYIRMMRLNLKKATPFEEEVKKQLINVQQQNNLLNQIIKQQNADVVQLNDKLDKQTDLIFNLQRRIQQLESK